MTGPRPDALHRHKHAVLLALLCIALAIETVIVRGAERFLSDVFRAGLGVAIWYVVFERPRERAAMGTLLVVSIALGLGRNFAPTNLRHAISVTEQSVLALFLCIAVCVILRDLFRRPASGAENVLGSICGYLVAGDAFARINAIAYLLVPSAFSIDPAIAGQLPEWHGRVALFTYYAFSQVLMLGYSDVTPVSAPATTLSLFAALFGVFYTAVVVSVLVSMAQNERRPPPGGK
jgi:hypothetical protein